MPPSRMGRPPVAPGRHGSLADVLLERGPRPEAEARGAGVRLAQVLDRLHRAGVVHGAVTPANVCFSPEGDLWLADHGTGGGAPARELHGAIDPRRPADDVVALAVTVVECAVGVVIDPAAGWTAHDLTRTGCPPDLAADVALVLADPPAAARVAAILRRDDDRLPAPPPRRPLADPTPTIDIPPVWFAGLEPVGVARPDGIDEPARPGGRRGWRRWARGGHD